MSDEKVKTFDPSKKRKREQPDLDLPWFERKEHKYDECDHSNRGFTYDTRTREVHCRCGVKVEAFDALVFYARGEQHLKSTRYYIEEHERKKAEEKAKKPFVKEVRGMQLHETKRGAALGREYRLECGHTVYQHRGRGFKRIWRTATCTECYKKSVQKETGVVAEITEPPPKQQETKW